MTIRTVLVDADVLVHRASVAAQSGIDWGDGVWSMYGDECIGKQVLDREFATISTRFPQAEVVACLSDRGGNWRKVLESTYKANRTAPKPLVYGTLVDYVRVAHRPCVWWDDMEADDVMGVLATGKKAQGALILSPDKDLDQIPCHHLKSPRAEDDVYSIGPKTADMNHLVQALAGDSTDGVPGCPGAGPKTAARMLAPYLEGEMDASQAWQTVVSAYRKKGLGEKEAVLPARLVRVLREGEVVDGAPVLWGPPS